jgi:phosphatidylglycerol---prolipoprotein diacylglyceryl transferase
MSLQIKKNILQFPFYIHIGEYKILLHSILEPVAFFVGFRYFLFLKKSKGDVINSDNRTWIVIAVIFGALIGSRLIGGLEDPAKMVKADNILLHFYLNKTVLGGFLGGLFAVELVKKLIKENNSSGDLFVYPIIFALIIGRIGCFSMGIYEETYGSVTSFAAGMNLGDGLTRHPVALYEILFLIFLWITFRTVALKLSLVNGSLFKLFMITYLFFRFFIDFIKPHYTFSFGLSTIQLTCLLGFFWYIRYIINPRKLLQQFSTPQFKSNA